MVLNNILKFINVVKEFIFSNIIYINELVFFEYIDLIYDYMCLNYLICVFIYLYM